MSNLRWRHGLAKPAENIRNIRHKLDPKVDQNKVQLVEAVLKDLIETGFADNCDEELLEFDEDGNLKNRIQGLTSEMRQNAENGQNAGDEIMNYKNFSGGEDDGSEVSPSDGSDDNYQDNDASKSERGGMSG